MRIIINLTTGLEPLSLASMIELPRSNPNESRQEKELCEQDFKRMIRQMGLKVTQQRLHILKALHDGRAHVTAQEVFEVVQTMDSSIGFATVYRFLRKMTENHLVTEVRMGGLPARYEITPPDHHDHLTCTKCGKIVEFENQEIERLQQEVAKQFGFELEHHVLELYGICETCQKWSI